ncbi:MAG: hypothetical protein ABJB66_03660, partial [Gemmatimonadaceae bacterium]
AGLRSGDSERKHGILGAPTRFRFEYSIEGEVSDDVLGELLDVTRRETGLQGAVSEAFGAVEWKGRDSTGVTIISITRRTGRTNISVLSAKFDAASVHGILGVLGTVFGTVVISATMVATAHVWVPLAILGGAAGAGGGSWLTARASWRKYARRSNDSANALGEKLAELAQQSTDEPRIAESDNQKKSEDSR